MPTLEPCYSRVLIRREKKEQIGSVIIPESSQLKQSNLRGEVVAIGPDVNDSSRSETRINVGDVVVVGVHTGSWIDEWGEPVSSAKEAKYYVVQDEDIIMKVVDNG